MLTPTALPTPYPAPPRPARPPADLPAVALVPTAKKRSTKKEVKRVA